MQRLFWASVQDEKNEQQLATLEKTMVGMLDEQGAAQAQGFMELVNWSFKILNSSEENFQESPSIILACAWIHAGQIHRIVQRISNKGLSFEGELSRVPIAPTPSRLFDYDAEPHGDAALPTRVRPSRILASGISTLCPQTWVPSLGDPTKSAIGEYLNTTVYWNQDELIPSNILGSFLAHRGLPLDLHELQGLPGLSPELLGETKTALLSEIDNNERWFVLSWFLEHSDFPLRIAAQACFQRLVEQHGFAKLLSLPGESKVAFQICAQTALKVIRPADWLIPFIFDTAKVFSLSESRDNDWLLLLQFLLDASLEPEEPAMIASRWADAVTLLLEQCPEAARHVRMVIGIEFHRSSIPVQKALAPLLLLARSLP